MMIGLEFRRIINDLGRAQFCRTIPVLAFSVRLTVSRVLNFLHLLVARVV